MLGEILIIIAQLAVAAGVIMQKRLLDKIDPLLGAFVFTAVGAVALAPILLAKPLVIPPETVWLVIISSVLMQAVWAVLYYYGLSMVTASNAAVLTLLFPVFMAGIAIAFLGEQLTAKFIAGAALVAAGVLVIVL